MTALFSKKYYIYIIHYIKYQGPGF